MSLRYLPQDSHSTPRKIINSSKEQNSSNIYSHSANPNKETSLNSSRYSKFSNTDFKFDLHDSNYCVCQQCDCGQHKCKLQCIKPQLRSSSTYRNSYRKTSSNFNTELKSQFTPKKTTEKTINNMTTYQQKFPQKQINVQKKIKHADHQQFTGPSLELTTYQQKYPGYAGKNPYVRYELKKVKKKPDEFRGGLIFKGESMYDSHFLASKTDVNKPIKRPDNLRTSSCWFGKSSYRQAFKVQNPQDLKALDYKPKSHYDKRPSSAYQFETSYKRVFENPQVKQACPAKSLLMKLTQAMGELETKSQIKRI